MKILNLVFGAIAGLRLSALELISVFISHEALTRFQTTQFQSFYFVENVFKFCTGIYMMSFLRN